MQEWYDGPQRRVSQNIIDDRLIIKILWLLPATTLVLETPLLYYIVTAPIRSNWWTVWSEAYFYTDLWFPLQLAGAAGAGVYGYILLYDCATFRGAVFLPMWVM